ncbi:MAG: FAD-dependent oxidoreductase, partial [Planctomycetes bacterium]|nr:FAD-dependent oxidoreductase [Planctomycetota bacterium]
VVVGGGTAGAAAGIGAGRAGAKTLVIEYLDELGGVGTAGLIGKYWYGNDIGFTAEVTDALGSPWNVVRKSEWYRSELSKAGVDIWHGSFGCGAILRENKVAGVVVATSFGRGVVLADVVVDATGNADVAAAAGAPTEFSISSLGDVSVQIAGYPHRNLGDNYNNTAFAMVDDRDVFDRWQLLLSTTRGMKRKPYDMGQLIDTRDRRRIVGDYTLSTMDILMHRKFPDTISHHESNFDAAAFPDSEMFFIKDMKGPVYACDMPIRCLIPRGLEGLLAVGLGASTERDAMTLTRMQADVQNQGYAAGVAAAVAVKQTGGAIRDIDIRQLQSKLVDEGCLDERVLTQQDSFPISSTDLAAAVDKLHELTIDVHQNRSYDDTFPALAAVMSHPADSIPLLRDAYRKAVNDDAKSNFAWILAVLGDSTGRETLMAAVQASDGWGGGYGLTSHRETHNTFGPIDRLVIALGFLRTPEVRPILVEKLKLLDATSDLSHYKAICLALRLNKDESLVLPLARALEKPGVRDHAQPLPYYAANGDALKTPERTTTGRQANNRLNSKFKELLIAALLFECGDHNGLGREVLEAYTRDVNGHFATYADFVLHG